MERESMSKGDKKREMECEMERESMSKRDKKRERWREVYQGCG